ncbi:MAG: NfeD family protein [Pseudomonadaceae bacterium]|nr:NfeD family protein [Pseudomonadaceae bacterium]
MTPPLVWILLGLFLILSELVATSIIAVFLGLGALATGGLLYLGIINSLTLQLLVFSAVSLLSLLLARRRLKQLFVGGTIQKNQHSNFLQQAIGQRVEVVSNFEQGAGRVKLNGVQWTAYSEEALKKGDAAWIIHNEGIELYIASKKPNTTNNNA